MFQRQRLGEILVDIGALSGAEVDRAVQLQAGKGQRLGEYLVEERMIRPEELARALAIQADVESSDSLDIDQIDLDLLDDLPIAYARGRSMLPIRRSGNAVDVAVLDPFDIVGIDQVATALRARVEPIVVPRQALVDAINVAYDRHDRLKGSYGNMLEDDGPETSEIREPGFEDVVDLLGAGDDDEAPVIQFVNTTFVRAARDRASDIHIEPHETRVVVRFRVDGVLQEVAEVPKRFHSSIAARIKIMAGLNIAEKRLPQDGRIRIKLAGKDIDIRVATVPLSHGERITMRLLDKSAVLLDLRTIGMDPRTLETVEDIITRPYGIMLVTGPTGSGKTTTLYSCLSKINTPDRNILTVEDPVEYQLPGISQVAVNPKIELTFASGLRSFLRHDPDVIMVGEIRDQETAEIAIQASLTGHLVFSTLHTNSAAGALTRLLDMGIDGYLIGATIRAVVAQRLVRKLCRHCAGADARTGDGRAHEGGQPCGHCRGSGYSERTAIYEIMEITPELGAMIARGASEDQLVAHARAAGVASIEEHAASLVEKRVTTREEVQRVLELRRV